MEKIIFKEKKCLKDQTFLSSWLSCFLFSFRRIYGLCKKIRNKPSSRQFGSLQFLHLGFTSSCALSWGVKNDHRRPSYPGDDCFWASNYRIGFDCDRIQKLTKQRQKIKNKCSMVSEMNRRLLISNFQRQSTAIALLAVFSKTPRP